MSNERFLGVCILLAAFCLSIAIVWHAYSISHATPPENGRYQLLTSNPPGVLWRLDTKTGKIDTNP